MNESELERKVQELIRFYGLFGFHARDSRRSAGPGFPDWVICGKAGLMFRELKSETGELSPEQRRWRNILQATGHDWSIWRPADLRSGRIGNELKELA